MTLKITNRFSSSVGLLAIRLKTRRLLRLLVLGIVAAPLIKILSMKGSMATLRRMVPENCRSKLKHKESEMRKKCKRWPVSINLATTCRNLGRVLPRPVARPTQKVSWMSLIVEMPAAVVLYSHELVCLLSSMSRPLQTDKRCQLSSDSILSKIDTRLRPSSAKPSESRNWNNRCVPSHR